MPCQVITVWFGISLAMILQPNLNLTGVQGEWFWEHIVNDPGSESDEYFQAFFPPKFTYQNFGPMLTMDFFNATEIARIVAASGAKSVNHH